jgi:hypothetical protein
VIAGLLLLAAAPELPPVDPVAAVETCMSAVGPSSINVERLTADGWAEKPIENIDKAPGGAADNRLFHKVGSGVIHVNVVGKDRQHHCHWLISADRRTADAMNALIGRHFGGKVVPMGESGVVFQPQGRSDVIVMSSLKKDKKGGLYEVHTMAFDLNKMEKEVSK